MSKEAAVAAAASALANINRVGGPDFPLNSLGVLTGAVGFYSSS